MLTTKLLWHLFINVSLCKCMESYWSFMTRLLTIDFLLTVDFCPKKAPKKSKIRHFQLRISTLSDSGISTATAPLKQYFFNFRAARNETFIRFGSAALNYLLSVVFFSPSLLLQKSTWSHILGVLRPLFAQKSPKLDTFIWGFQHLAPLKHCLFSFSVVNSPFMTKYNTHDLFPLALMSWEISFGGLCAQNKTWSWANTSWKSEFYENFSLQQRRPMGNMLAESRQNIIMHTVPLDNIICFPR